MDLLVEEADPASLDVDVDELHVDLIADLDDLLGALNVMIRQLGEGCQAFDALFDSGPGARW
jgi:hypothetical protein